MWQDIRVAWRFLVKRRTATTVAVLTLGVAVAVCTIAFGLVDQAVWRPLAFDREGELATLYNSRPAAPWFQVLSYPDYTALRDRLRDSLDLAAFLRIEQTMAGDDGPALARGEIVSPNYFDVLGAKAFAGDLFRADDTRALASPAVVLSHDLWRRRFGSNPAVIGRPTRLGRDTYTVAGVAPPGFQGPAYRTDFWIPLVMTKQVLGGDYLSRPEIPIFQTVARLRGGITWTQAQSLVRGLDTSASRDAWRLELFPAGYLKFWPAYRSAVARFLSVFALLAACILLLASANLAGLLVARAAERRRELALRQALGASRIQLLRRLAAESLILTALGAAAGTLLAFWTASLIEHVPLPVPAPLGVTIDARLGAIAVGAALIASLFFTSLSALPGLRSDVREILASSAGTLSASARAQQILVVVQVALSCILLILGGLLSKSAFNVAGVDIGFEPASSVIGTVGLFDQGYSAATGAVFYDRLQEALEARPETEAVTLGWHLPLWIVHVTSNFSLQGVSPPLQARYDVVGTGYFRTLRIPMRGGREFTARDSPAGEPVAIVNETMAARFVGDAIGQTIKLPSDKVPRRVIGIARDIKYNAITESPQPFVYLPLAQAYRSDMHVYLRTRASHAEAIIRNAVRALDPNVALSGVRTMEDQVADARSVLRTSALISGGAALVAVFLALVGVYGVLTTSVERRRRELAIRAALGAAPAEIVRRIVIEGATLTGAGLMLGIMVSVSTARLIGSLLFQMGPYDATVYGLVPLLVIAASAGAWIAPARRAARVDPVVVLKSE